jgi:hypothetical protein
MAKKTVRIVSPDDLASALRENVPFSFDAIAAIGEERREYLAQMKQALESDNIDQLKVYARRLCGMPPDPTRTEGQRSGKTKTKKK